MHAAAVFQKKKMEKNHRISIRNEMVNALNGVRETAAVGIELLAISTYILRSLCSEGGFR